MPRIALEVGQHRMRLRLAILLALAMGALCSVASACRYNVRDIAFVNLREAPYVLSIAGAPEEAEQLVNELGQRLSDTNLAPRVSEDNSVDSELRIRLESPDGRTLPLELPESGDA